MENPRYEYREPARLVALPHPMSQPYAKAPIAVITNTALSPWARLLVPLLAHHHSDDRGCFPGRDRLAAELGCSTDTVDRAVGELVKAGIVTKKRQGRGHTNRYELADESAPMRSQSAHESAPVRLVESAPMRSPESAPVRTNKEPENQEPEELDTPKPPARTTKAKATNPEVPLPADWAPTEAMVEQVMAKHGLTRQQVDAKTDEMRDWAEARGRRYVSWDAAWRKFMAPKPWDQQAGGPTRSRLTPEEAEELRRADAENRERKALMNLPQIEPDSPRMAELRAKQNGGR